MDGENKQRWTDDEDLVARYVLGQMTPEEKKRLEAELAEDEAGKAKIREESEFAAGIRRHGRDMMKAQLRTKLRRARATQFTSFQYIGLAAAVVVVAIGIGVYQIFFSDLTAPKKFQQQEVVLTPQEDSIEEETIAEAPPQEKQIAETRTERPTEKVEQNITTDSKAERFVSGPAAAPVTKKSPVAAAAEDEAVSVVDQPVVGNAQPQSIWLIGRVVMISDRSIAAASEEKAMKRERSLAKEKSSESAAMHAVPQQRLAKDAGIVLQQSAIKDLPVGLLQRKDARVQTVQTLLERSESGLSLTLYGDVVNNDELQDAVVEKLTDDSLVVSLPHQRIAFRLPAGWNAQPARR
jgi:hypothetical protein